MKKILLFLLIFPIFYFSQDLYTKDNVNLGDKFMFLKSCIDGFDKENINLNGMNINKNRYCSCFCDNLIPQILSTELFEAIQNDNIISLLLKSDNLNLISRCFDDFVNIEDDYVYSNNELNVYDKKFAIKTCVEEVLASPNQDHYWTISDAEKYCNCSMNTLYSKGYTFKDIQNIENESSVAFNEIVMPCVEKVFNKLDKSSKKISNRYVPKDISGSVYSSEIRLIDYSQSLKIKIEIDGFVKYFIFDTGASDLIIDKSFQRELLKSGAIDNSNYIGKKSYIMANNEEIIADIIKIDNLKVGEYVVDNIYIAVVEKGGMLCGKSLFDKFSNWEFNKNRNILTLYK